MNDSLKAFLIKIGLIVSADETGKAAKNLDNVARAAENVSKTASASSAPLGEAGKKLEDIGEKGKKAAHGMNQARLRGELFRRVMMSIGQYTPGLEYAVMGGATAFGALTAAAIGAGIALEKLFGYFRSFGEKLEELNVGELKDHAKAISSLQTSWDDAKGAAADYFAKMDTAGQEGDPIKKQLDGIKQVTDAQIEARKKIIEVRGKEEIARLRASGASQDQIAAAQERTANEVAKLQAQQEFGSGLGGLMREKEMRRKAAGGLDAQARAAMADSAEAAARKKQHDDELAAFRAQIAPGSEQLKQNEKELERVRSVREAYSQGTVTNVEEYKRKMRDLDQQITLLESFKPRISARIRQLEGSQTGVDYAATLAADEAERKKAESISNRARLRELPGEIGQAQQVQAVKDQTQQALELLKTRGGPMNQTLSDAMRAAHESDSQAIALLRAIQSGQITLGQAFAGMFARQQYFEQQMRALSARIQTLK